jgi:hypothetical protein
MGHVPRWKGRAYAVGWGGEKPVQVAEENDLAEKTHWDICGCLEGEHYCAQSQEQRLWLAVLV